MSAPGLGDVYAGRPDYPDDPIPQSCWQCGCDLDPDDEHADCPACRCEEDDDDEQD